MTDNPSITQFLARIQSMACTLCTVLDSGEVEVVLNTSDYCDYVELASKAYDYIVYKTEFKHQALNTNTFDLVFPNITITFTRNMPA